MKTIRTVISLLLFFTYFLPNSYSQYQQGLPPVVINEVGYNSSTDKTYIELLVLGNTSSPDEKIDLSGWTIDNYSDGNDEDQSLIELGDFFNEVEVGTILIIYDPDNPFEELSSLENSLASFTLDKVVFIPLDSKDINIINVQDYQPAAGRSDLEWKSTLGLSRSNNGLFLGNPQGRIVNGVAWTNNSNPYGNLNGVTNLGNSLPSGGLTLTAGTLCPSDIHIQVGVVGSPGVTNNPGNANSNGSNTSFSIGCSSNSASGGNPEGLISFIEGVGPYSVEVKNSEGTIVFSQSVSGNMVLVPGEFGESYSVKVTDSRGCKETCNYFLPNSIVESSTCEGVGTLIGEPSAADCFKWEPTLGLEDPGSTETVASPTESTTYTLLISDGCGQITSRTEYQVNVSAVEDLDIISNPDPAVVYNSEVVLSVSGTWQSFEWMAPGASTPTDQESFIILPNDFLTGLQGTSREYSVVVTDENGCTTQASIIVGLDSDGDGIDDTQDCNPLDPNGTIDSDGDGFCDEEDCDPNSILLGGIGSPCDDFNVSTLNDVIINSNCECAGTPDVSDPCNGDDQDGDGICDLEDEFPYNPCLPNFTDSDGDGTCDELDCDPNSYDINSYVGESCDDNNASTVFDQIDENCNCVGIADPNNPCDGLDNDGDGICNDLDPNENDPCNDLSIEIEGELSLCGGQSATTLTANIEGGILPYSIVWSNDESQETIDVSIAESRTYSVTITDALNCQVVDQVELEYYNNCDDVPCEVVLPIFNSTNLILDNYFSLSAARARTEFNCELGAECIPNSNTCVLEYVPLEYDQSNSCIVSDNPIEDLREQIDLLVNGSVGQTGILVITSSEFLCECPSTADELIARFFTDVDPSEVGIWINFPSPNQAIPIEVHTIGIDHLQHPLSGILDPDQFSQDDRPLGGIMHSSQAKLIQPGLGGPDYQGNTDFNGVIDYADLDKDIIENIIQKNAELASSRYETGVEFIISTDCMPIHNKQGIVIGTSLEMAKQAFDSNSTTDIVYWIHRGAGGQVTFDVKFNINTIFYDPIFNESVDLNDKMREAIFHNAAAAMELMKANNHPLDIDQFEEEEIGSNGDESVYTFGFRDDQIYENEKNGFGILKATGGLSGHLLKKGEILEDLWRRDGECLFDVPGVMIAPIDAYIEEVPIAGVLQAVDLFKTACKDEEVRKGLIEACSDPVKLGKSMFNEAWNNVSGAEGREVQQHVVAQNVTAIGLKIMMGGGFATFVRTLKKETLDNAHALRNMLRDFPKELKDQFYKRSEQLFGGSQAIAERYFQFLNRVGELNWKKIISRPDLLNLWNEFNLNGADALASFENALLKRLPFGDENFLNDLQDIFTSKIDDVVEVKDKVFKFIEDVENATVNGELYVFLKTNEKVAFAWDKLFVPGNSVSDLLRNNKQDLAWFAEYGDDVPQDVVDDLIDAIDKPIKETLEDQQGRLTHVLDRPGQSNKVVTVHPTSTGELKTTTYNVAYNPELNPDIEVPVSANRLTPDYINSDFMHPLQGTQVVKIKLSGNRSTDFARSRAKLGITIDEELSDLYTWHHMDDFEIIDGEAYGTMQLVERTAHQGTGVTGMQHSGSAAQWRAYYGSGYN